MAVGVEQHPHQEHRAGRSAALLNPYPSGYLGGESSARIEARVWLDTGWGHSSGKVDVERRAGVEGVERIFV